MIDHRCILTGRSHSLLRRMLERHRNDGDPLASLLRRKLAGAVVVPARDVPPDIVTLGTRVRYRTDDGISDIRIVSDEPKSSAVGNFLSIGTPVGLALLGLAPGQACHFGSRCVTVEKILFQPEENLRARREERAMDTPENRRASFRVIGKSADDSASRAV